MTVRDETRRCVSGESCNNAYRQRLSIAERSLYNGERNRGKLVFEVLKESVRNVRLELPGFVMGFDADGLPSQVEDLVFDFEVKVRLGVGSAE